MIYGAICCGNTFWLTEAVCICTRWWESVCCEDAELTSHSKTRRRSCFCFRASTRMNWIITWLTPADWDTIKAFTTRHLNSIDRIQNQSCSLLYPAPMQEGIFLRLKKCGTYSRACSLDRNQASLAIRRNYKEADFPFGSESPRCLLIPPCLTPLPSVALQAAGSRLVGGFCSHLAA